jgi:hypothetical protein
MLAHDLLNEYRLWLHRIVLASGKRLFNHCDPNRLSLRLVDSTVTGGDGVILTNQTA